jgi:hypothetical protein
VAKQHEEEGDEAPVPAESQDKDDAPMEEKQEGTKVGNLELSKAIRIKDPLEFRRSMPLFSMPAKTDVEVVNLGINKGVEEK